MNEIAVIKAVKNYKKTTALNGVSVNFQQGKIYGLIGRNGAGKSTLIKAIGNRVFLNSGSVTINGEQNAENKKALSKICIMSENNIYPKYKIRDIFRWSKIFNDQFNIDYANELAEAFSLNLKKKPKELSTGYASILKFILTMSSGKMYLFLDEPVLGLDATHRDLVYKIILDVQIKTECAVVISTHIIEEVSNLIEDVVIIDSGTLLECCNKQSLLENYYNVSGSQKNVEEFSADKKIVSKQNLGGFSTYCIKGEFPAEKNLDITFERLSLQQLFINMTKTKEGENNEN